MIKAVLLDVGGVVYVGDTALPGSVEAVSHLRTAGLSLRFLTNTTRTPRAAFITKLRNLGLSVADDDVFMPAIAARQYLLDHGLRPHLLIHPALQEDFADLPEATEGQAVVVGDAGAGFTYVAMNEAFRALEDGAAFLALARNRTFRDDDGDLSLDAGPFVVALEFATGRQAEVLGKPSEAFFAAALASIGCQAEEAVMIGDDAEADVGGAMAAGLAGVLVQTGKYRPGDEARLPRPPDAVMPDLAAAVRWVLARQGCG